LKVLKTFITSSSQDKEQFKNQLYALERNTQNKLRNTEAKLSTITGKIGLKDMVLQRSSKEFLPPKIPHQHNHDSMPQVDLTKLQESKRELDEVMANVKL
jgi:hypothetical protein